MIILELKNSDQKVWSATSWEDAAPQIADAPLITEYDLSSLEAKTNSLPDEAMGIIYQHGKVVQVIRPSGEKDWLAPGDFLKIRSVMIEWLRRDAQHVRVFETAAEVMAYDGPGADDVLRMAERLGWDVAEKAPDSLEDALEKEMTLLAYGLEDDEIVEELSAKDPPLPEGYLTGGTMGLPYGDASIGVQNGCLTIVFDPLGTKVIWSAVCQADTQGLPEDYARKHRLQGGVTAFLESLVGAGMPRPPRE